MKDCSETLGVCPCLGLLLGLRALIAAKGKSIMGSKGARIDQNFDVRGSACMKENVREAEGDFVGDSRKVPWNVAHEQQNAQQYKTLEIKRSALRRVLE